MGTVTERPRKNGSIGHFAQIVIKRDGKIVHRAQQTFDRKPAAWAWIEKREKELTKPGAIGRLKAKDPPLSDVIMQYNTESLREIGKTKAQVLNTIANEHDIAQKPCSTITSQDLVDFARTLRGKVAPSTVNNYMSHLGAIFSIARPAWGYQLDSTAMDDAMKVSRKMGYIGKSKERDRRPTLAELDLLMEHFGNVRSKRKDSVPMQKVTAFAIFSTRRQEEITTIKWADLDEQHSRILVRDMKHPGEKIGNDQWCDLPKHALDIILSMPLTADEIFPFSTDAIGAAFTRACRLAAIEDLHFHDLRHDGVSGLFEMDSTIPKAASVSGHRSWQSLKRYTHLRQTGDKYAGWKWLPVVTAPEPEGNQARTVSKRRKTRAERLKAAAERPTIQYKKRKRRPLPAVAPR